MVSWIIELCGTIDIIGGMHWPQSGHYPRGVWGHAPPENFGCSEATSDGFLGIFLT